MKSAIAIRHVHFEDLGLVADLLGQHNYGVQYRDAGVDPLDRQELAKADLLVVLGGPIGAYEDDVYPFLADEIAAVCRRLERERPTLGICLGAQIMARALGKRVYPSGVKELGWGPVRLTEAGLGSVLAPVGDLPVLHWHGDTFDLPEDAHHLASTDKVANQAFSLGDHGLGLQFHLEAEIHRLEPWYIGHAGEIAATSGVDVATLRAQAERHGDALAAAARQVFTDWLERLPA